VLGIGKGNLKKNCVLQGVERMSETGAEKNRKAVDPGNILFVVYVGIVMCVIFLAIVAEGYAAAQHCEKKLVSHGQHQEMSVMTELEKNLQ